MNIDNWTKPSENEGYVVMGEEEDSTIASSVISHLYNGEIKIAFPSYGDLPERTFSFTPAEIWKKLKNDFDSNGVFTQRYFNTVGTNDGKGRPTIDFVGTHSYDVIKNTPCEFNTTNNATGKLFYYVSKEIIGTVDDKNAYIGILNHL